MVNHFPEFIYKKRLSKSLKRWLKFSMFKTIGLVFGTLSKKITLKVYLSSDFWGCFPEAFGSELLCYWYAGQIPLFFIFLPHLIRDFSNQTEIIWKTFSWSTKVVLSKDSWGRILHSSDSYTLIFLVLGNAAEQINFVRFLLVRTFEGHSWANPRLQFNPRVEWTDK